MVKSQIIRLKPPCTEFEDVQLWSPTVSMLKTQQVQLGGAKMNGCKEKNVPHMYHNFWCLFVRKPSYNSVILVVNSSMCGLLLP